MTLQPAQTLSEIRENCHPGPLRTDAELLAYYEDISAARSSYHVLVEDLRTRLGDKDIAKILVYGHRGSGKSTEFSRLSSELGEAWFPITVPAADLIPPFGVEAEEILLAIAIQIVEQSSVWLEEAKGVENALAKVEEFFADITETATTEGSRQLSAGAGIDTNASFWGKLIGYKAKLEGELKYGKRNQETAIHRIRQRPGELVASLNALIATLQEQLGPRQLLILVEDLDKLTLQDADRVFARKSQLLAAVRAHIIYTIPIFTLHCAEMQAIRASFPCIKGLPMPKVIALDGSIGPGYDAVRRVILRRIAEEAITPEALDLVIRRSGGVLRDAFESLVTAASFRRATIPLGIEFVQQAHREMANARALAVAYPPEEGAASFDRKDPAPLFGRLAEIARLQAKHTKVAPTARPDDQLLLAAGALVEYNDDQWLGVHPLLWLWMAAQEIELPPDPFQP